MPVEHALFVVERALFVIEHTLLVIEHALFVIEHALFVIEHELFVIEHAHTAREHGCGAVHEPRLDDHVAAARRSPSHRQRHALINHARAVTPAAESIAQARGTRINRSGARDTNQSLRRAGHESIAQARGTRIRRGTQINRSGARDPN